MQIWLAVGGDDQTAGQCGCCVSPDLDDRDDYYYTKEDWTVVE
jgi:putative hemolysin